MPGGPLVPSVRRRRDRSDQGGQAGSGAARMMRAARPITDRPLSKSPHWSEIRPQPGAEEVENSALVGNSTSRGGSGARKVRIGRKFDRYWLVAAVAVAALVLTGCGSPSAPAGSAPPMAPESEVAPSLESTAGLAIMKKKAGIADCPKSDPDVAPTRSG